MADITQLSDTELEHLAAGGASAQQRTAPVSPMSGLSNEELQHLASGGKSQSGDSGEEIRAEINRANEAGDTSNENTLNTLTFGHLPQIKAKIGQVLSGEGIANDQSYVNRRDQEIANMKARAEKFPGAAREGKVVGFALPMLATMGGSAPEQLAAEGGQAVLTGATQAAPKAAAGFVPSAAKGAATGAAMGFAQNPGDQEGVVDPIQLEARGKNAAIGALVGGATTGAASQLPKAAEAVSGLADKKAFKAIGAMLKDTRVAASKDEIEETGRFALDNGLVQAGDTFDSIAGKAEKLRDDTGKALGAAYEAGEKILPKLNPQAADNVAQAGFNPVRDKTAVLQKVKDDLGYSFRGKQALQAVSDYLDQLGEQHGNQTLSPGVTNEIKTALDQTAINWERNPLSREPDTESALKTVRSFLNSKVSSQVQAMGEAIGNPEAAKNLAALNQKYGMAAKIARISGDRANRELANKTIGLTDTISGTTGATIGATVAGPAGAAIGSVAGAAANKAARTFGPAGTAAALNATGRALSAAPNLVGDQALNPSIYQQIAQKNVASPTQRAMKSELDKDSSTSAQEKIPLRGRDKWARDGFSNLEAHGETGLDLEALMNNPKTKELLIQASDLRPGSKAMQNVIDRIKAQRGSK